MLVVGLTGGIGSGKTTVAKLFEQLGAPIIDADAIARDLTEPKHDAWHQITQHFGNSILKEDGSLDRVKMRDVIFNDAQQRQWLEQLLHPMIKQEMETRLQNIKATYCLVVIPLLVETGPYSRLDRILVVDASEEAQLKRLQVRDQASIDNLHKILRAQASPEKRLEAAQDVIHNDGNLDELKVQVDRLHEEYMRLGKSK